jgi:hypothetical protein
MQHDFILLDRSGSMAEAGKWPETLNAINAYVKKLADEKVDTGVTLAVFDQDGGKLDYKVVRDRITPPTWKPVTIEDATPRGWTPLNDAIGRLVSQAEAGFNGTQYSRVAIIIMTDGMENASKELTVAQAKALLEKCRAKGWQVIFLGADYDNAVQAASYGNSMAATADSSIRNLSQTMDATASLRSSYGITGQSMEYSDEQKKAFRKK